MRSEPVLTANQLAVFEAMTAAATPLSAYAILERLRAGAAPGIRAPLQVYRALDKLTALGLVHRLESLNAFIVCDQRCGRGDHPPAFAICDACGQVAEFVDPSVEKGLTRWSKGNAFRPKRVTVELRGLCENCDGASK